VCYKVDLCENRQQQSCKAFIGHLSVQKWLVGVPLRVNFWAKVNHPLARQRMHADTQRNTTTMEYKIYNNAN